jgi:Polysaccharide deacetylase
MAIAGWAGTAARAVDRRFGHTDGLVSLIYHRVGQRSPSPVDLPTDTFRRQMAAVAATERAASLDDALANGSGVVVTFDDGTSDWLDVVLPALEEYSVPAVFYVATQFIDEQIDFPDAGTPLTWAALGELASHPLVTIGAHTHSHRVLADVSADEAERESTRCNELLAEHLGIACRHFAYPKAVLGSPSAEVVIRRHYASAALAGGGANKSPCDPFRLRRTPLTVRDTEEDFTAKLAGGGRLEGVLREWRDRLRAKR